MCSAVIMEEVGTFFSVLHVSSFIHNALIVVSRKSKEEDLDELDFFATMKEEDVGIDSLVFNGSAYIQRQQRSGIVCSKMLLSRMPTDNAGLNFVSIQCIF